MKLLTKDTATLALVQPIVIKPADHFDTVAAVALASGLSLATAELNSEPWRSWLAGSFTKSVRRAKRSADLERVRSLEQHSVEFAVGDAVAFSFEPQQYSEMPKEIKRLQVSGCEATRKTTSISFPAAVTPHVEVNTDVTMSTCKTAAQVAHALGAWLIGQGPGTRRRFAEEPGLAISEASFEEEPGSTSDPRLVTIRDNGLTEIAPGTATARVWLG